MASRDNIAYCDADFQIRVQAVVQDSPSRKQDQFIVRLPDGMRDRIREAAEASNRSMNAEIVATLERAYPTPAEGALPKEAILHLLQRIDGVSSDGLEALLAKVKMQPDMLIKARANDAGDLEFLLTPISPRSDA